jgi:hypothetical protein
MEIIRIMNDQNRYFQSCRVRWSQFEPTDIYFKRNILTRQLDEEINVIRWKNKTSFMDEYSHGVFVSMSGTKDEFPNMEINIYDKRANANHNGHWHQSHNYTNNLVYIHSHHYQYDWVKDPNDPYNWVKKRKNVVPMADDEAYFLDFHNMGARHPDIMQEQIDIVFSVRNYMIDRVLPTQRKKALTKVA